MADPVGAATNATKGALTAAFRFAKRLIVPAAIVFTCLALIASPTAAFAAASSGTQTIVSTVTPWLASAKTALTAAAPAALG